jgi:integrase
MGTALRQAVRWDLIPAAVTERAKPAAIPTERIEGTAPETVFALIEAAEAQDDPVLAIAIKLAAVTGCRRGELCGLRWSDLDTETGVLTVSRAIKHRYGEDKELLVGAPKTHQARPIALDSWALAELAGWRVQVEAVATIAGTEIRPNSYILPGRCEGHRSAYDPAGRLPERPDRITQAFGRLTAKLGIKDVTFHSLRHFAATQLLGAGVDVRTVADRLGHSDPSITLRVYADTIEARDREAAAVLGEPNG